MFCQTLNAKPGPMSLSKSVRAYCQLMKKCGFTDSGDDTTTDGASGTSDTQALTMPAKLP